MKMFFTAILTFVFCANLFAQSALQQMFDTEKAFEQAAAEKGMKAAFLEFLSDDSIIFSPNAINGKQFWQAKEDSSAALLVRKSTYGDISANGLLGYTMGDWRLYPKGKSESLAEFGQYVTIWEKRQNGRFFASVDIGISHDKLTFADTDRVLRANRTSDPNKRGWSPTDSSMNFQRMSMSQERLGAAYKKFAADDVRLLIERQPPILGKKNVVAEMGRYISIEFPKKTALFQSADMAYTWNPCQYANSNEGTETGNCLHVWKLRNKKWWIVLGVFARVNSQDAPVLKTKKKNKKS